MNIASKVVWHVLLVDDDEDDYILTRSMLQDAQGRKIALEWAASYETGQQKLQADQYDAVLVDYDLGPHTGIELIREAVAGGYAAPLILFTGRGSFEVDVEAMQAGAALYLTKNEANPLLLERAIRYAIERKQAEAALRQREKEFRAIFELANAGNTEYDPVSHRYLRVNQKFCEITGYTEAELHRMSFMDITHPEDRTDDLAIYQAALWCEPRRWDTEKRYVRKDGAVVWVAIAGSVVCDDRGNPHRTYAVVYDITERRRTEAALRESEARERAQVTEMNAIMDAVPAIVCVTHDPEVRKVTGNRLAYEFLRVRPFGNLSKSASQGEAPPHFRVYQNGRELRTEELPLQLAAATGTPVRAFEEEVVFDDGSRADLLGNVTPLLDEAGRPAGAVAAFIDITERKRAEEALHEREEMLRLALTAGRAGAWSWDPRTNTVQWSEEYYRLFGYEPGSLEPSPEAGLSRVHPDDLPRVQAVIREALERSTPIDEVHRVLWPDGSVHWVRGMAQAFFDEPGRPTRVAGIAIDITAQKQAELDLEAAHRQTVEVLESIGDAFYSLDREGRFTYVNRNAAGLWGMRPKDLLGKNIWEVFPAGKMTESYPKIEQALADRQPFRYESYSAFLDRWLEVHLYPTEQGISVYFHDISVRKQAEAALRESEDRFRTSVEAFPDGFAILSAVRAEGDGEHPGKIVDFRYEYINEAGCRLNQRSYEEHVGHTVLELLPGHKAPELFNRYVRVVETGQLWAADEDVYEDVFGGGQRLRRTFDSRAVKLGDGFVLTWRDISARKQMEEALRESEARFRQLADAMPQLVWTAQPDGTVDYYNQRYQEYHGITPSPEESWQWAPVLHPDDQQPTVDAWERSVETGELYQIEHRARMADGSYRWHLSRGVPVRDPDGRVLRWYGTSTDIHALKLAEQALQEDAEALEYSNQELQDFAFIASHDLQEPLRKIKQFGNQLSHRLEKDCDEGSQDYLQRMISAAERMQAMVQDLLELSRVSTHGKPFEAVDLSRAVEEALSDLEVQIQKEEGQVEVGALPQIKADPLQMHQLFQNLIGNALKYHRPGVAPQVSVTGEIQGGKTGKTPMVVLKVEDNGIGFDEKEAERIFQPFQRLHGRGDYKGTGIGLAICKKIVERHGGKITANSTPGKGSTFTVTLPVKPVVREDK